MKKAEDNEDDLNKAVEEVELKLLAVEENKEQIKLHLDNPIFHPTLNSAITLGIALLLVLIGILTKCCKKYGKQLDSDSSQQEGPCHEAQPSSRPALQVSTGFNVTINNQQDGSRTFADERIADLETNLMIKCVNDNIKEQIRDHPAGAKDGLSIQ